MQNTKLASEKAVSQLPYFFALGILLLIVWFVAATGGA